MRLLVLWVAALLGLVVSNVSSSAVRTKAFGDLAERSAPLVEAIESFAAAHGEPPGRLEDLVPEFLAEVPGTGMGAYPEYLYYSGERAEGWQGNPWILMVGTPRGFINFDLFLYLPNQDYPEHGFGGWLERIGDWAYVHE